MRRAMSPDRPAGRHAAGLLSLLVALAGCRSPEPDAAPVEPPAASGGPAFFIGDQLSGTRRATRAVVDAGTIWLLDEHGDFVFGADPAANWTAETGLSLTWKQVTGAAKYHVMARLGGASPSAWKELQVVTAPDEHLNPTVVAGGLNPWTAGLGVGGHPWSFGGQVQFAVSAEDARGTFSEASLATPLATADAFPGVLTGVELDGAALPVPFAPEAERGALFHKGVRLSFSEPMRTSAVPVLTSLSSNLAIREVAASAWGTDPAVPLAAPPSAAAHAFLSLALSVKGACTELLVARTPGDLLLEVRDTAYLGAAADARLLFLDGSSGALLGEAAGVAAVDAALGRLTLQAPLAAALPAGSLVCALSGAAPTVARLASAAQGRLTVSDAAPFFVGERVAVYRPAAAGAAPLLDLRTVTGVDSAAGVLALDAPPAAGHDATSLVVPLHGLGAEASLRPSAALALLRDAAGGAATTLRVTAPTSLMVGDTVLVDADGRLETTPDQAQATVRRLAFAPATPAEGYVVELDLPAGLTLLHDRAVVLGLGDAIQVGGTQDTSAAAATPLDHHADQFSPDGRRF